MVRAGIKRMARGADEGLYQRKHKRPRVVMVLVAGDLNANLRASVLYEIVEVLYVLYLYSMSNIIYFYTGRRLHCTLCNSSVCRIYTQSSNPTRSGQVNQITPDLSCPINTLS
jgi:hypothetical protein